MGSRSSITLAQRGLATSEAVGLLDLELEGKRCLVTGAANGIGRAVVRRLSEEGARVVGVDIDRQGLDLFVRDGVDADVLVHDIRQEPAALANTLIEVFGPIPLIVNSAGIFVDRSWTRIDEAELKETLDVNLIGPWLLTRALTQELVSRELGGSVVFLSSVHQSVVRGVADYSVSKAGLAMLVKEMAYELAPHSIRVNSVSPGAIATQMARDVPRDRAGDSLVPLRRIGHPDDVAAIVLALLSDVVSSYVTGADIVVDGGLTLHSWVRRGDL